MRSPALSTGLITGEFLPRFTDLMRTHRSPSRGLTPRILSRSLATLLVPVVLAVSLVESSTPAARATVTASETTNVLIVTLGAANDAGIITPISLVNDYQVSGTGLIATNFPTVSQINAAFTAGNQSLTLTNTTFPFAVPITITAGTGAATDSVLKSGNSTVIITNAANYGGGTLINGGAFQLGTGGTTGSIIGNVVDNAQLIFNRSNALTFSGLISGTGSVTMTGGGTLTLTGPNNYSGGTTITNSKVSISSANAIGTGPITLNSGAELITTGTFTLANNLAINTGVSATLSTTGTLTFDAISLSGALTIGSTGHAGTVIYKLASNAVNSTGSVDVAFGTLRNGGGLETITPTVPVNVHAGATLDVNDKNMGMLNLLGAGSVKLGTSAATNLTLSAANFSGVISGAGHVNTSGPVTLTGANTYTGGTTIITSSLQLGNGGTTGSIMGNVVDNGNLIFDHSNAFTFAGNISGTGTVTQAGAGVLTLTGNNTYSGGTNINTGKVSINNANALGTGNVHLATGTELIGTGNITLANEIFFSASGASTVSTTGLLNLNSFSMQGPIIFGSAGHTGVVSLVGSGTFAISAGESVDVAFGTLRNGGLLNFVTLIASTTTVETGATLDVNNNGIEVQKLVGSGSVTLGTNAATNLMLDAANFTGVISGAGKVTINGPITFTTAHTYTGGTIINSLKALTLGNGGTTGMIAGNVTDNGNLTFKRSDNITFPGNISGTGTVTQAGAGVLTLTGNNTYSGGTNINTGKVSINNANALGTGNVHLATGTELIGTGNITLANEIFFSTSGASTVSTTGVLNLNSFSLQGPAVFGSAGHTGVVSLVGSGTFAISAGESVDVAFGTLRNGGLLNFVTLIASTTTVETGATLDVNNNGIEVQNLVGTGSVTLGNNAATNLILDAANFGGVISGAGNVSVNGFVILTGANTYTGGTTINASKTLQLGNGGTTGTIAGNVVDNGTLTFNHSNAFTFAGNISGTGLVTQAGTGTLTLTGSNTYTGGTHINAGKVSIGSAGALGNGVVTLATGTELITTGTFTLPSSVNIPAGTATISTTGSLTLGAMSLAGSLVFGSSGHAGTVILNQTGVLSEASTASIDVAFGTLRNGFNLDFFTSNIDHTTVEAGATLDVNDQSMGVVNLLGAGAVKLGTSASTNLGLGAANFSGVISGAGRVTANGLVIFTGANTYTGGTTINSGKTLQLGNGGTTGSVMGNISSNGNLIFNHSNAFTFAGNISGSGFVTQAGTGVLTLTGNNTYTGGTNINSGTVSISSAQVLGPGTVTLAAGAELTTTGTFTLPNFVNLAAGTTTISTSGTLTLGALTLGGNVVFGSTRHAGTIIFNQTGVISENSAGSIDVAFGTLRDGFNLNFFTSNINHTTIEAGATLDVHDQPLTVNNLLGAGMVMLGTNAATNLGLFAANFGGLISGTGGVTANGLVTFTGANTYTGGTTINSAKTLQLGNGGTTGTVAGNIVDNGNLTFNHSNAFTFAGKISGTGSVTQAGAGVLTLTGANTYSGGTVINNGKVSIASASNIGTGSITIGNGTELITTGSANLTNFVSFSSGTSTVSTTGTLSLNGMSLAGVTVIGSAGHTGTVAINLAAGSSASGVASFDVAFGTLRNAGNLSSFTSFVSSTTVESGATFDLADNTTTVKNLLGAGKVTLGTNAATQLTLSAANFSGVISGAGKLSSSGGAVTLSGANTFTGGTTISSGILQLGNGGTTGSVAGNILDNAMLTFDHSNAFTFAGVISGTGKVTQAGTGVLTLTGNNTYSGGTIINGGSTLAINSASGIGTGSVTIGNGAELTTAGTANLVNFISFSSGTSTVSTTGTLSLNGMSLSGVTVFGSAGHTGTVAINLAAGSSASGVASFDVAFGTLRNGGNLSSFTSFVSSTTVNSGATFDLADNTTSVKNLLGAGKVTLGSNAATQLTLSAANFSGVISGAGKLSTLGGTVTLSGANTYTGGTTVQSGQLLVKNTTGSATGTGAVTVNSGATLGGSGHITGATTLNSGGVIEPGVGSLGTAGTTLHAGSLLWNGGGTLDFQIGSVTDQLLLTGAFTKGSAGLFNLDILNAGIGLTGHTFTLMTFASTTFTLADFNLVLPASVTGTLVLTATSLQLQNLHDPPAMAVSAAPTSIDPDPIAALQATLDSASANLASVDNSTTTTTDVTPGADTTTTPDATTDPTVAAVSSTLTTDPFPTAGFGNPGEAISVNPAPEPTSLLLLACGTLPLLARRRRR